MEIKKSPNLKIAAGGITTLHLVAERSYELDKSSELTQSLAHRDGDLKPHTHPGKTITGSRLRLIGIAGKKKEEMMKQVLKQYLKRHCQNFPNCTKSLTTDIEQC